MNYYIIDTWNGQGYSDSGLVSINDDLTGAKLEMHKEFEERYLDNAYDTKYIVEEGDNYLSYSEKFSTYDSGAITILEADNPAGILIMPDTNDAMILKTKADVDSAIELAYINGMDDEEKHEFMHEIEDSGRGAIHTDLGYQIIYNLK